MANMLDMQSSRIVARRRLHIAWAHHISSTTVVRRLMPHAADSPVIIVALVRITSRIVARRRLCVSVWRHGCTMVAIMARITRV
jgi:hypothetical protein